MRKVLIIMIVIVCGILFAQQKGSAQGVLVTKDTPLTVEPQKGFSEFPLTIECRVKLEKSGGYNIIIANETKASATHWELFTMPDSGNLTLYVPGFAPDHVYTNFSITDGRFHHIAATIEKNGISLFVDGERKVQAEVQGPQTAGKPAALSIGKLTEGGIGCVGEIAEVRISRGVRPIVVSVVSEQMSPENDTIALWRFDDEPTDNVYADLSGNKNDAVFAVAFAQGIVEGKSITAPFIPLSVPVVDMTPIKKSVTEFASQLKLQTVNTDSARDHVWQEWYRDFGGWNKIDYADRRPIWFDNRKNVPDQVFDKHSLIWPEDGGPAGTAIRRTEALLEHLSHKIGMEKLQQQDKDLQALKKSYFAVNWDASDSQQLPKQLPYYMTCCLIRRQLVFQNPLLDFDDMLFVVRGTYAGSIRSNPQTMDMQGGHFVNQYFGFNALPGGGLFVTRGWKNGTPIVTNLLEQATVQNGRLQGKKLNFGAFCTPDVDFDGKRISFSWCGNQDHQLIFSKTRLWHVFTINSDGSNLVQLTDGAFDDFDSCWLPNGRLAFISERRGGYIRCFSGLVVPQFSLFSMKDDGSDIFPLSYYETSEWNPTVNNDGKIVYTRWDYTDRENCLGSRFWICGPDGTDPRAPHGNYPNPWHTFPDQKDLSDSRMGAPRTETSIRAIPGSSKYLFTAAPHHGDIDGTICILDLSIPDDGHMAQIKRVTPDELFPESELSMRSHFKYKTPWPLSEDYYLANCWENLVLLDRFGNKELICDLREVPCKHDDRFRAFEPIPLHPRTRPPMLPTQTSQEKKAVSDNNTPTDTPKATISVMNVYESDQPMPEGVRIKWLRIVQNVLKCTPEMGDPMIGYERENTPRIPLGIVPVEEDGSAYFEAPIAKELIFQVLDENKMAVQSMRSVAYVHPGEQLSCTGCHENHWSAGASAKGTPLAVRRQPSKIEPELDPIEPISYYRQIKPIFEKHCIACHQKENVAPTDMSYEALKEDYTFWFSGAMLGGVNSDYSGVHGGTRSIPGRFGARYCKIGQAMLDEIHQKTVPEEVRRVVNLWLDCNSLRLTAFHRVGEQLQGELVWPYLDVDPANPLGVEGTEPSLKRLFWHQNMEGPHPCLFSSHTADKVFIMDEQGKIRWEYACNHPQDVWMLENGNVLVAWYYAVQEIEPDYVSGKGGKVVWQYTTEAPNEIPNCQPLPNGNVMIGIVGECRLIEVDRQGRITHEVKLETTEKAPHAQFRLCRKTPEGTYLVPFTAEGAVREYDADGKVIHEFPKASMPVGVARLPDGNTLISADGKVTEYDANHQIVWQLGPNDIPDINIGAFAGLQRLPNGNTIVCNWNATPSGDKSGAHIFEVTHDKRVVWEVESNDFGQIATCQLLTPEFQTCFYGAANKD